MFNENTMVTSSEDGEIKFWDINSDMKEQIHTLSGNGTVSHMTIMKDGTLVTAGSDSKIRYWKAKEEVNAG